MIVNGKPTTASVLSIALKIFLETETYCDYFGELKRRFTTNQHDSMEIAQGKKLLFEIISSVEKIFYRDCREIGYYENDPDDEMGLIDIQFMILEALLEIACNLFRDFEIPFTTMDTSPNHQFSRN